MAKATLDMYGGRKMATRLVSQLPSQGLKGTLPPDDMSGPVGGWVHVEGPLDKLQEAIRKLKPHLRDTDPHIDKSNRRAAVFKAIGHMLGEYDEDSHEADFIVSTEAPDRDGDTVSQETLDWSEFDINPVMTLTHDTDKIPVGKWLPQTRKVVTVKDPSSGDEVKATQMRGRFNTNTEEGREVAGSVKDGFLSAASVSFLPQDGGVEKNRTGGSHYQQAKVTETAVCAVPANQGATRAVEMVMKKWKHNRKAVPVKGVVSKTMKPAWDISYGETVMVSGQPKQVEEVEATGKRSVLIRFDDGSNIEVPRGQKLEVKSVSKDLRFTVRRTGSGFVVVDSYGSQRSHHDSEAEATRAAAKLNANPFGGMRIAGKSIRKTAAAVKPAEKLLRDALAIVQRAKPGIQSGDFRQLASAINVAIREAEETNDPLGMVDRSKIEIKQEPDGKWQVYYFGKETQGQSHAQKPTLEQAAQEIIHWGGGKVRLSLGSKQMKKCVVKTARGYVKKSERRVDELKVGDKVWNPATGDFATVSALNEKGGKIEIVFMGGASRELLPASERVDTKSFREVTITSGVHKDIEGVVLGESHEHPGRFIVESKSLGTRFLAEQFQLRRKAESEYTEDKDDAAEMNEEEAVTLAALEEGAVEEQKADSMMQQFAGYVRNHIRRLNGPNIGEAQLAEWLELDGWTENDDPIEAAKEFVRLGGKSKDHLQDSDIDEDVEKAGKLTAADVKRVTGKDVGPGTLQYINGVLAQDHQADYLLEGRDNPAKDREYLLELISEGPGGGRKSKTASGYECADCGWVSSDEVAECPGCGSTNISKAEGDQGEAEAVAEEETGEVVEVSKAPTVEQRNGSDGQGWYVMDSGDEVAGAYASEQEAKDWLRRNGPKSKDDDEPTAEQVASKAEELIGAGIEEEDAPALAYKALKKGLIDDLKKGKKLVLQAADELAKGAAAMKGMNPDGAAALEQEVAQLRAIANKPNGLGRIKSKRFKVKVGKRWVRKAGYKIAITGADEEGNPTDTHDMVLLAGPNRGKVAVFPSADAAMKYVNNAKEINYDAKMVPTSEQPNTGGKSKEETTELVESSTDATPMDKDDAEVVAEEVGGEMVEEKAPDLIGPFFEVGDKVRNTRTGETGTILSMSRGKSGLQVRLDKPNVNGAEAVWYNNYVEAVKSKSQGSTNMRRKSLDGEGPTGLNAIKSWKSMIEETKGMTAKEDDDGAWIAFEQGKQPSATYGLRFENQAEAQKFVAAYNRGDEGAKQYWNSQGNTGSYKSMRKSIRKTLDGDGPNGLNSLKSVKQMLEEDLSKMHKTEQGPVIDLYQKFLKMIKGMLSKNYGEADGVEKEGEQLELEEEEAVEQAKRRKTRKGLKSKRLKAMQDKVCPECSGQLSDSDIQVVDQTGTCPLCDANLGTGTAAQKDEGTDEVVEARDEVIEETTDFADEIAEDEESQDVPLSLKATMKRCSGVLKTAMKADDTEEEVDAKGKKIKKRRSKTLSKKQKEALAEVIEYLDDAGNGDGTPPRLKAGMKHFAAALKDLLPPEVVEEEEEVIEVAKGDDEKLEQLMGMVKDADERMEDVDKALYRVAGRQYSKSN